MGLLKDLPKSTLIAMAVEAAVIAALVITVLICTS